MTRLPRFLAPIVATLIAAGSVLAGATASAAPIRIPSMTCTATASPRVANDFTSVQVTLLTSCGDVSMGFLACAEEWFWLKPTPATLKLESRVLSCRPAA